MSDRRRLFPPDVPFSPAQVPAYYGWVVVGAATLGILASLPGQTMGVSVFTDALLGATGLSRLELSNAYLVGTLVSAGLLPAAGRWLDRVGVRVAAMVAAGGLGIVVGALSQVEGLVAAWPGDVAAFVILAVLFFGVRFTGQGLLTLASQTMLGRWFVRRRGTATAVSGLFVAFGFAIAPRVLDAWIGRGGWSMAYVEIAVVEIVGVTALAWLLFREDPESSGLVVDGGVTGSAQAADPEPSVTREEALLTRAFWVLTLAVAWHGLVLTGVTMHIVDLGREQGLDRVAAVAIFVPMAVVSTSVGALAGWLADRVAIRRLLQTFLVAIAVGYPAMAFLDNAVGYGVATVALGVAGGHFSVLTTVGLPRFFGRLHLGTIGGASMTATVLGSALGPSVLAASRAGLGSYVPALLAAATVPLVLLALTMVPLHPRDRPAPA